MSLKEWAKKFKSERQAILYLQEKTGLSERHLRRFLKGWKTDKFSTAVKLSEATGLPVEEFLKIPPSMSLTISGEERNVSK